MQRGQVGGSRDVRTILFTDIVGSTDAAGRLGDRAWSDLLAHHHALVRAALRRTNGHEEDSAGDGFFATFARPTDALACAVAIVRDLAGLGLDVRVGLHAGEVELRDKASGITVHTAARLMAAAGAGEVLASATVRELTAGAGWKFDDRGSLSLKGLAEPVHGYALDLDVLPALMPGPPGPPARRSIGQLGLIGGAAIVAILTAFVGLQVFGGATTAPVSPPAGGSPISGGLATAGSPAPTLASPTMDALPIVVTGKEMVPGLYVANEFPEEPTLTIADPGWSVANANLILTRTTSPADVLELGYVAVLASDPCGYQAGVSVGPDPEAGFLAWARSNPALRLGPSSIRRFGDLSATEYDIEVVPAKACAHTNPPSVAITPGFGGNLITTDTRTRVEVSSRNGQLLLIGILAPRAGFDTFEPLAEKVLGTFQFNP
jgi:class 3 adenylate cyclase